ncbi:Na(+)/H(+) antiporter NhaA [compost metagenome]
MKEDLTHLPRELADKFTGPFLRFVRIEAMAGATLLICVMIALALANSSSSAQYFSFWETRVGFSFGSVEYSRSLQHWINDGLMTLFFFVVALELKREMVLGELVDPQLTMFPLAGAFGGMIIPVGIYLLLIGDEPSARGWGTVMSTDTAFVIGCLALLGRRVPESLRLFLLALAIFDDIAAILVMAISYGGALQWLPLMLAGLGLAVVAGIGWVGIRSTSLYFVIGISVWVALDASGIHATLTGVVLGLMAPARSWVSDDRLHAILGRVVAYPPGKHWSGDTAGRHDLQQAGVAAREALSPIERLEIALHPWIAFAVMPAFALANAGVTIVPDKFDTTLVLAIFVGFVIGKPVGIVVLSALAVKLRIANRPKDLPWRTLAAGSMLAGIGFTMALFIAGLAFSPDLLGSVKVGILLGSLVSAIAGMLVLVCLCGPSRR